MCRAFGSRCGMAKTPPCTLVNDKISPMTSGFFIQKNIRSIKSCVSVYHTVFTQMFQ